MQALVLSLYGNLSWPTRENQKVTVNIADLKLAKLHLLRLKSIAIDTSTNRAELEYDLADLKNLHDLLLYSPRVLESYEKILFVLYQLLRLVQTLHAANLTLGGQLKLTDVFIDDNYWIRIKPSFTHMLDSYRCESSSSSDQDCHEDVEQETNDHDDDDDDDSEMRFESEIDKKLGSCPREIKTNLAFVYDSYRHLNHRDLTEVTKSWCSGQMSNFAYLLILNCIAGEFFFYLFFFFLLQIKSFFL